MSKEDETNIFFREDSLLETMVFDIVAYLPGILEKILVCGIFGYIHRRYVFESKKGIYLVNQELQDLKSVSRC